MPTFLPLESLRQYHERRKYVFVLRNPLTNSNVLYANYLGVVCKEFRRTIQILNYMHTDNKKDTVCF